MELRCEVRCEAHKDCGTSGLFCDATQQSCRECLEDTHCAEGEFCGERGACVAQNCVPGASFCAGESLRRCDERGEFFSEQACAQGCENAACRGSTGAGGSGNGAGGTPGAGGSGSDSGGATGAGGVTGSGGSESGSGGAPGTGGGSSDFCSTIPEFTRKQVVDGIGDDFEDIPPQVFDYASAPFKRSWNSEVDHSYSRATLRAAWDSIGLRAHLHVRDRIVQSVTGTNWDGDAVQFLFGSRQASTGSLEGDSAMQLLVIPPTLGHEMRAHLTNPLTLEEKFAARLVSDGYEIEVFFPWFNGFPENGGEFVFNVLITVDDLGTDGRDFQYALGIRPLETPRSPCLLGYEPNNPFCDTRRWCAPRTQGKGWNQNNCTTLAPRVLETFNTVGPVCYILNQQPSSWSVESGSRRLTIDGSYIESGKRPIPGYPPFYIHLTGGNNNAGKIVYHD